MDTLLAKYFSCSLCNKVLVQPKELPCHHVYCAQCLEEASKRTHNQELDCSKCGTKVHLPNGLVSLSTNGCLKDLIDRLVAGVQASVLAPHPECKQCDENAAAKSICVKCNKYLCEVCDEYHRKAKKTHEIRLLKDTEKVALDTLRCAQHNKKMSLYCWNCDCLICSACAADSNLHGNHRRESIAAALPRCSERVELATDGVRQVVAVVKDVIAEIKSTRDGLELERGNAEQQLEDGYEEALRKLREEKERQLAELKKIYDAKHASIESQLEQCGYIEEIMKTYLECSAEVGHLSEAGFLSIYSRMREMLVGLKTAYQCNIPQHCEVKTVEVAAKDIPDFTDKIGKVFITPKDKAFIVVADISKATIVAGKEFQFTITCTDIYATCLHYNGVLPQIDVKLTPLAGQADHDGDQDGQVVDQGGQVADQGGQVADQGGQVADQGHDGQAGQVADQAGQVADQAGQVADQAGQVADQAGQVANPQANHHAHPALKIMPACTVILGLNGSYTVTLLSQREGPHRLTFKAAGSNNDIIDPLDILVIPPVREKIKFKVGQMGTERVKVNSVTVRDNQCIYSDNQRNRIFTCTLADGVHYFKPLHSSEGCTCKGEDNAPVIPQGVAVDLDNKVIVADTNSHRVLVVKIVETNAEAEFIKYLEMNNGQKFDGPTTIAVNKKGRIFVSDSASIQYFNPDYTHAGQIRDWDPKMKGTKDTLYVAVDAQDHLLVASHTLSKVYVLKEDANSYTVAYTFGDSELWQNHNLVSPVGVAADCRYGYIYVIERERLCVFSREGDFLASFIEAGERAFRTLSGITVTKEGFLIVAYGVALMELDALERHRIM